MFRAFNTYEKVLDKADCCLHRTHLSHLLKFHIARSLRQKFSGQVLELS